MAEIKEIMSVLRNNYKQIINEKKNNYNDS